MDQIYDVIQKAINDGKIFFQSTCLVEKNGGKVIYLEQEDGTMFELSLKQIKG